MINGELSESEGKKVTGSARVYSCKTTNDNQNPCIKNTVKPLYDPQEKEKIYGYALN